MLKQSFQLKQQQRLSPQQIQLMKMLQIPTMELEQRIKEEMESNPALEEGEEEKEESERDEDNNEEENDNQEVDFDFSEYLSDDDIPDYKLSVNTAAGSPILNNVLIGSRMIL